jgi:hypothetical protein
MNQPNDAASPLDDDDRDTAFETDLARWLTHVDYPTPAELRNYAQGKLALTRRQEIDWYVLTTPALQRELVVHQRLFGARAAAPPSRARAFQKLIDAVLRPATLGANAVRGDVLRYETPVLTIVLTPAKSAARTNDWALSGRVLPAGDGVAELEWAGLIDLSAKPDAPAYVGQIDADGTFDFPAIAPGVYDLVLLTRREDVRIRSVAIRAEDPPSDADEMF